LPLVMITPSYVVAGAKKSFASSISLLRIISIFTWHHFYSCFFFTSTCSLVLLLDYSKRKTSNKAEMKSISRHILTPFDKEFHRKMRICNLKTSNFSKFEKFEKNLKKCMCGIPGQKWKSWVIFFFHIQEVAAKMFIYEIPMEDPTWHYDSNLLSRGYTQICSLVSIEREREIKDKTKGATKR
jgi:hypothetical protein